MTAKVVTVMRWYAQDEVNKEVSEQNEVDAMKKELIPQVMHMWKSGWWFVMTNEEATDGRAMVTRDQERVLPVDWTEIRLAIIIQNQIQTV